MKCGCGSVMTTRKEPYKYDISGLTGITLLNVPVHYCDACGERGVSIPKIEELHRLIAKAIIEKRERLVSSEFRFLRKYLGFSTADMGRYMGVSREHVSRWESGEKRMSVPADRLLRMIVATHDPIGDYSLETLKEAATTAASPMRRRFRVVSGDWRPEEAAA